MYLWIQHESALCPTWRSTRFPIQLLSSSSFRLQFLRFLSPPSLTLKLLLNFCSRTSRFSRTRPGTCISKTCRHFVALTCNFLWGKKRKSVVSEIVHLLIRIAVAREAQQVALEQELLEGLPLLFKNRPEQVSMVLECKGRGGQPCQGAANITVTVRPPSVLENCVSEDHLAKSVLCLCICVVWVCPETGGGAQPDIVTATGHQEAADWCYGSSTAEPGPSCSAHWELHHVSRNTLSYYKLKLQRQFNYKKRHNEFTGHVLMSLLRALVNIYKAQKSPAVQQVGVSAFYQVVSFVCEDTLRHPPTRQYLSSCVEILGQVWTSHKHQQTHTITSKTIHI